MPRVKSEPKKCIKTHVQQPTNSWVFVLKGEALQLSDQYTGTGTPDIVTLRHPSTGEPTVFLFSSANNSVQEILTFDEGKRSWFIGDSVKSDGKMHLSTPVDPIFLVLPYLRKYCSTQAIPLEHLLLDEEFPQTERLLKCSGLKYLNMVADRKGEEELNAFKYNEEKTLVWLKKKTERVADILKQKNIQVAGGATSATFIKSLKEEGTDSESYIRYAHGIVSEYLMEDLSQKLLKYLHLSEEANVSSKRKSTSSMQSESKKTKVEDDSKTNPTNVLDLSKPDTKTAKQTTKPKLRVPTGNKTITSFFKKT